LRQAYILRAQAVAAGVQEIAQGVVVMRLGWGGL